MVDVTVSKCVILPVINSTWVIFLYGHVYVRTDPRFELFFGQSTSIPSHGSGGGSGQDRSMNFDIQ